MNKQRVLELLDTYGADPLAWPAEERMAATELLEQSDELKAAQHTAQELDVYLNLEAQHSAFSQQQADLLSQRTIRAVNSAYKDKLSILARLSKYMTLPRYALAFSALLSIFFVMNLMNLPQNHVQYSQSEFDDWMLTQLTGDALNEDNQTSLDFIDLVELENDTDS